MINDIDEGLFETLSLTKEFKLALRIEKEYTRQVLIANLTNIGMLGICAFVALQFDRWWITLIGLLFQQSVKRLRINLDDEDTQ